MSSTYVSDFPTNKVVGGSLKRFYGLMALFALIATDKSHGGSTANHPVMACWNVPRVDNSLLLRPRHHFMPPS